MSGPPNFSRKHYGRLRQYWHAGRSGLSSAGDGIVLDLTAAGFLEMKDSGGGLALRITLAGIEEAQRELERERARRRPHHDLCDRVAEWLRGQGRVTWQNIELMVSAADGNQAIRPDVFSMAGVYDVRKLRPSVHEIKVSRADFLSDLAKPAKRAGYGMVAEHVYYVAPQGIIQIGDVPADCGLVVEVSLGEFEVRKRPKTKPVELTPHHFMNLILKPGQFDRAEI